MAPQYNEQNLDEQNLPSEINPNEIVVQEGEDKGRVQDTEVAHAMANAWNKVVDKKESYTDTMGGNEAQALSREIFARVQQIAPNADTSLQIEIVNLVQDQVLQQMEAARRERKEAANAEAQKLIDALKSGKSIDEIDEIKDLL